MPVRLVELRDSAEWLRMRSALWPEGATDHADEIADHLNGRSSGLPLAAVFVCEIAPAALCGFLELSIRNYAEGCTGPAPCVEGWYVDSAVLKRGVGGALMRAAEAWAMEHGFHELASDVEFENEVSLRAHEALGFHEVVRAVHFRKPLRRRPDHDSQGAPGRP